MQRRQGRDRSTLDADDERPTLFDESEQKAIIEELHRDHVQYIGALRTAFSILAALVCTLYFFEAIGQVLEATDVITLQHLDLAGFDSASLAVLMGLGAASCIPPLIAGLQKQRRAQPGILPSLWLGTTLSLGPLCVLLSTANAMYFLANPFKIWLPCAAPFVSLLALYSEYSICHNQKALEELKGMQYVYHKP